LSALTFYAEAQFARGTNTGSAARTRGTFPALLDGRNVRAEDPKPRLAPRTGDEQEHRICPNRASRAQQCMLIMLPLAVCRRARRKGGGAGANLPCLDQRLRS